LNGDDLLKNSIHSGLRQLPSQFPLLPCFFGFLSGIGLAYAEFRDYLIAPGIFPLFLLSCGVYLALISSRQRKHLYVGGVLLLGVIGYFQAQRVLPENHIHLQMQEGSYAQVEGIVWANPFHEKNRTVFNVHLQRVAYDGEWRNVTGTAQISLYTKTPTHWKAGDLLRFKKIKLKQPRNFKNPGRFNYQRFLRLHGIDVTAGLSKPDAIEKIGVAPLPFWINLREKIREKIYISIETHLSNQESALLRAMVFGDKSGLSEELKEAFASTGIGHLTAVSGLHIGFVAGFSLLLFRPIAFSLLWRWFPVQARNGMAPKLSALLAIVPVFLYMLLAGDKSSALRAGFMVLAVLLALLADREKSAGNALLLVAFLILLKNPEVILDAGFQMSFMAVVCILFVLQQISQRERDAIDRMGEPKGLDRWLGLHMADDPDHSRMQKFSMQAFRLFSASTLISLAAILGTLPIVLFHFHRISLSGFLLNPIITPFASLLIPLALAVTLISALLPALAFLLFWPIKIMLLPFLTLPLLISEKPWSAVYVSSPGPLWTLLWYGLLFAGIKILMTRHPIDTEASEKKSLLNRRGLLTAWCITALLVITGLLSPKFSWSPSSDKLTLTLLDVGQGESIFIQYPNGQTMMIDGGGFYKNSLDVGKRIIAPFLWDNHVTKIDYMIASHSDNDHISGLESLIDLFPVGQVLAVVDPQFRQTRRAREWVAKAINNGASSMPLDIGRPIQIGEARITPLHPDTDYRQQLRNSPDSHIANNLSIVLKLEYREFSILLTGDIESDAEDYLRTIKAPVQADFLKVPHHGSRYSSSSKFIDQVAPKAALFSSGYLNRTRHPHPETLRRYERSGVRQWRTDLDGAITLSTDGIKTEIISHPDL